MNIEDDLTASPVRLRHELRRLRATLPHDAPDTDAAISEEMGRLASLLTAPISYDERAAVLSGAARDFLCPLLACNEGVACACPGACYRNAQKVIAALEKNGFTIVKARQDGERSR